MAHAFAYIRAALIALCLLPLPTWAAAMQNAPKSHDDTARLHEFAICLGRFTAMLEKPDLVPGLTPDQIRTARADFNDLLAASLPAPSDPDLGHRALNWRIEARAAQTGLLRVAAYSNDPRRVRIALATLRSRLLACQGLLPR